MLSTKGFETLGDEFFDLFEYAFFQKLSRIAIPMMTVIADTGLTLDIQHIYSSIENDEETFFEAHTSSISDGRTIMFRNRLSPITLQVFPSSGKLQLAGCTSHIDAMLLTGMFLKTIGKEDDCTVQFHIKLMNMTCMLSSVNLKVSDPDLLRTMNAALQRIHPLDDKHRAEKREHYSACVVYMRHKDYKISGRLFSSGCMSITAQSPSDILRMLRFIVEFFHANRQYTYEPTTKDVQRTQKQDYWSFTNLMSVLSGPDVAHTHPPTRFLVDGCEYCQKHGNIYCNPDRAKML
jgi:hypothetical protein